MACEIGAVFDALANRIAPITGHTLAEVRGILDKHYLADDPEVARSAIRKLERRTKLPNTFPNGHQMSEETGAN
jgi:hypothetical protein